MAASGNANRTVECQLWGADDVAAKPEPTPTFARYSSRCPRSAPGAVAGPFPGSSPAPAHGGRTRHGRPSRTRRSATQIDVLRHRAGSGKRIGFPLCGGHKLHLRVVGNVNEVQRSVVEEILIARGAAHVTGHCQLQFMHTSGS